MGVLMFKEKLEKYRELKKLFKWLFKISCEGCDVDGGDLQDEMEGLGLIVKVKIPENKKRYYPACSEYDTDELFFAWYEKEVKAIHKAQEQKIKGE